MNPLVFLDFDGVISSGRSVRAFRKGLVGKEYVHPERYYVDRWFDPECVGWLNRVTEEAGAEIVLSTSWRTPDEGVDQWMNVHWLTLLLKRIGVEAPVVGWTPGIVLLPNGQVGERGDEIARWLRKHGGEGRRIAVLDDQDDMDAVRPWFVHCRQPRAFRKEHAARAREILAGPPYREIPLEEQADACGNPRFGRRRAVDSP